MGQSQSASPKSSSGYIDSVDLCFMLDCTGSMQSYINMATNRVQEIIVKVQEEYPKSQVRIGIVAYRDVKDRKRFEIFSFEPSAEKAKKFLGKLKADGGDDTPEDINGAFQKAIFKMSWQNPVRLLVHIADAPCHGKDFHNCSDSFPEGHKQDMDWDTIFKEIVTKRIDYLFIKILNETDMMFEKFKALAEKHGSFEAEISFQQEQIPMGSVGVVESKAEVCDAEMRRDHLGEIDGFAHKKYSMASHSHTTSTEQCFVENVTKNIKAGITKSAAKRAV